MNLPFLLGKTLHPLSPTKKTHIKHIRNNGFHDTKMHSEVAKPRREKYNSH